MKVILLENFRKLGAIGDIIDVKRGFARNFLISNKKALFASKKNIKEVEKIKQELSKKDLEKKKHAIEIHEKIKNKTFDVKKLSKSIGTFKVKLNLHSEIQSEISIKVIPEENTK